MLWPLSYGGTRQPHSAWSTPDSGNRRVDSFQDARADSHRRQGIAHWRTLDDLATTNWLCVTAWQLIGSMKTSMSAKRQPVASCLSGAYSRCQVVEVGRQDHLQPRHRGRGIIVVLHRPQAPRPQVVDLRKVLASALLQHYCAWIEGCCARSETDHSSLQEVKPCHTFQDHGVITTRHPLSKRPEQTPGSGGVVPGVWWGGCCRLGDVTL